MQSTGLLQEGFIQRFLQYGMFRGGGSTTAVAQKLEGNVVPLEEDQGKPRLVRQKSVSAGSRAFKPGVPLGVPAKVTARAVAAGLVTEGADGGGAADKASVGATSRSSTPGVVVSDLRGA